MTLDYLNTPSFFQIVLVGTKFIRPHFFLEHIVESITCTKVSYNKYYPFWNYRKKTFAFWSVRLYMIKLTWKRPTWIYTLSWEHTTDIYQRSQNLCHIYTSMGLNRLRVFSHQNNHGSSGVYVTGSNAVWAWRWTRIKHSMACKDRGRICFALIFACSVGKNLKIPKLSPVVDDAITRGG